MSGSIEAAIRVMDPNCGTGTWGMDILVVPLVTISSAGTLPLKNRRSGLMRRILKPLKSGLMKNSPLSSKKTKQENAGIRWGDETGLCNDSYHGRGYAPRWKTPAIALSARCKRVNLISTITNQGKARFMIYIDRVNADTFIKLMKRLIKGADRKIFLILDNLRVHHSYKARDWLQEHTDQIEVFFLPSYSPELNPDEYLNCYLKTGVHAGTSARTKSQLNAKALSHVRKLQKMPKRVIKYLNHKTIAFAA